MTRLLLQLVLELKAKKERDGVVVTVPRLDLHAMVVAELAEAK